MRDGVDWMATARGTRWIRLQQCEGEEDWVSTLSDMRWVR